MRGVNFIIVEERNLTGRGKKRGKERGKERGKKGGKRREKGRFDYLKIIHKIFAYASFQPIFFPQYS